MAANLSMPEETTRKYANYFQLLLYVGTKLSKGKNLLTYLEDYEILFKKNRK